MTTGTSPDAFVLVPACTLELGRRSRKGLEKYLEEESPELGDLLGERVQVAVASRKT